MKQEQLKKLAEWCGYKVDDGYLLNKNSEPVAEIREETEDDFWVKHLPLWHPHQDSNQLDMLEDKMLKENELPIWITMGYKVNNWIVNYAVEQKAIYVNGLGKTKNEARLNAILNYVEKK